jgi:predicted lactoylglutathione lyase
MKKYFLISLGLTLGFILGSFSNRPNSLQQEKPLKLGAFSVSLTVKDIKVSKQYYENIGFTVFGGSMDSKYLIMKNGNALIGLFQGMFEKNILTFNPGWDENAKKMKTYDDIRTIQENVKRNGIKLDLEIEKNTKGPGSFMLTDPDGNQILFDQHI